MKRQATYHTDSCLGFHVDKLPGRPCHVLNRGNGGATVFHKDGDYRASLDLLATKKSRFPVNMFGVGRYSVMKRITLPPGVNRQQPFGEGLISEDSAPLGLEFTMRGRRGKPLDK